MSHISLKTQHKHQYKFPNTLILDLKSYVFYTLCQTAIEQAMDSRQQQWLNWRNLDVNEECATTWTSYIDSLRNCSFFINEEEDELLWLANPSSGYEPRLG